MGGLADLPWNAAGFQTPCRGTEALTVGSAGMERAILARVRGVPLAHPFRPQEDCGTFTFTARGNGQWYLLTVPINHILLPFLVVSAYPPDRSGDFLKAILGEKNYRRENEFFLDKDEQDG